MSPELVVPDLRGFQLRPYVSYRTDFEIEKKYLKLLKRFKARFFFFAAEI